MEWESKDKLLDWHASMNAHIKLYNSIAISGYDFSEKGPAMKRLDMCMASISLYCMENSIQSELHVASQDEAHQYVMNRFFDTNHEEYDPVIDVTIK